MKIHATLAMLAGLLGTLLPLGGTAAASPTLGPLEGAAVWVGAPVTASRLRGKVVIVDIFTVDCINCRNVVATLRELDRADRAKGLRIVGIHSPETPSEKRPGYVAANMRSQGIVWPVAIDNDFALWRDYGAQAWPTQLFFDRHGRLRKVIVGDSQDALVRQTVEALLAER